MKDKLKDIQSNKQLLEAKITEYEQKLKQISSKANEHIEIPSNNKSIERSDTRKRHNHQMSIKSSSSMNDDSVHGRKAFQPIHNSTTNKQFRDCMQQPPLKT